EATRETIARWRDYPALRSSRAVEVFKRLRPALLAGLARAAEPDAALAQFDAFLRALPAGVQLFSLFEANPQLVDLICDICATSPGLAAHLSHNPGVLDAVIGGEFFAPWPGEAGLTARLAAALETAVDYEARLDGARRWAQEWRFRIGVHHLRGLIGAEEAAAQYSALAGAVLRVFWPLVTENFALRHGPPPGRGAAVLGMGSLGARAMAAGSDLDLIVIYDAAGHDASEGPKPLSITAYYARLTQALVTALSARMAGGQLYAVDMRLRPSGRQGPVAAALEAFRTYQSNEAWTWEHMALTRARVVAGSEEIGAEIEAFRRALLDEKGAPETVEAEIAAMRARIARAADAARVASPWEAKLGPGRMQDIELVAQGAALVAGAPVRAVAAQLRAGVRAGWLSAAEAETLGAAHELLSALNQAARLVIDRPLDLGALGEGACAFVLRETGAADAATLATQLAEAAQAAARIVADVAARAGVERKETL
ncbi:MAG: glutamine-synthetase adenylyltransferase, partial [Alphaproteobacteria bacterium HGW-Alphaproteobacteria-2]